MLYRLSYAGLPDQPLYREGKQQSNGNWRIHRRVYTPRIMPTHSQAVG
jgi:hypothetical protein